jgi:dodecin
VAQVFKSIELVGVSEKSFEDAVQAAVRRAGESMRNLRWLQVVDHRGSIEGGAVREFQVTVRIWFELDGDG